MPNTLRSKIHVLVAKHFDDHGEEPSLVSPKTKSMPKGCPEKSSRNNTCRGSIPGSYKNPSLSYLHGVLNAPTLANKGTGVKMNVTKDDVANDTTNKLGKKPQVTKGGLQGTFTKPQGTYLQSITK
mmetsp:Transcript_25561/g.55887  ORF Transcript_25561/g.55887 Transcript_25561/m.55887 type:complete len:126 (-) Transcript_25561:201-578(-)